MRVLLIKTSSMGDIIHTLPALTDAGNAIPGIRFDWVIEDTFAEIPRWHPLVDKVIPVSLRRWRKELFAKQTRTEWKVLRQQLRETKYDLILDAQSLVKSSFLTWLAQGKRAGLDWASARESLASLAYQEKHIVNFYQHAIVRMRQLFSLALGYELPNTPPDFGINRTLFKPIQNDTPVGDYLVFLHGTMWTTKQWPENYWIALVKLAEANGFRVKISGGNADEVARAHRIAAHSQAVDVIPRLAIGEMAALLVNAKGAVAVDTGFGHLAAALEVPTVSIYGPTNPDYTGALGNRSVHLAANFPCAPCLSRTCTYKAPSAVHPACYGTVPPANVWRTISVLMHK
ncbi:MAG: lipopolysaccharide heptosyltransferase I [Gammaproteobacteria bacterium]